MKKMKSIKKFKINELVGIKLTTIYGGTDRATSMSNDDGSTLCDVHHDTDNDGKIDEGECVDFVECK